MALVALQSCKVLFGLEQLHFLKAGLICSLPLLIAFIEHLTTML